MKKFLILSVLILIFTGCNPKSENGKVKIEDKEIQMEEIPVEEVLKVKNLLLEANKNNIEKFPDINEKNLKIFVKDGINALMVDYYKDKALPNSKIYLNGEICESKDYIKDSCIASDTICPSGLKFTYSACQPDKLQNVSDDKEISGKMVSLVMDKGKLRIGFSNIKNNAVLDVIIYRDDGRPINYVVFKKESSDPLTKMINFYYHDNGKLKKKEEIFTYSSSVIGMLKGNGGILNNITLYYENGNIEVKSSLKNGKEVGVWNYYNEDGKLKIKLDFNDTVDGYVKKTTFFKDYYKTEYANKEGKSNGWVSSYDNNGKLIFQFDVKDSVLLGNKLLYDEDGKLAVKIFEGKNRFYFEEYYDDGSLKERFERKFKGDGMLKSSLYYPDGKLKSNIESADRNILYKDFYTDGNERYNISIINGEDKSYCINEEGEKVDVVVPDLEELDSLEFIDLGCGKFQFLNSDRKLHSILEKIERLEN